MRGTCPLNIIINTGDEKMISYIKRRVKDNRKYETGIGILALLLSAILTVASVLIPVPLFQIFCLFGGMIMLVVFYVATFIRTW